MDVPEKYVVTFKPGKEMEEKVRKLEEEQQRLAREAAEAAEGAGGAAGEGGIPASQEPHATDSFGSPQGFGANPGGAG